MEDERRARKMEDPRGDIEHDGWVAHVVLRHIHALRRGCGLYPVWRVQRGSLRTIGLRHIALAISLMHQVFEAGKGFGTWVMVTSWIC